MVTSRSNSYPNPMLDYLNHVLETLRTPEPKDAIHQGPPSARNILSSQPALLIKLAHSKIHTYTFDQVPLCWRRLFTDASICQATKVTLENVQKKNYKSITGRIDTLLAFPGENQSDFDQKDARLGHVNHTANDHNAWIQDVVRLLDLAIIVAGAPERHEMIDDFLKHFQSWVEEQECCGDTRRPKKRRKASPDYFSARGSDMPKPRKPISRCSVMPLSLFERHISTGLPLVIQEALLHWPAFDERPWKDPEYLLKKTFGGRRLVPVELGKSYTDEGWSQRILTFKEFMTEYLIRSEGNEFGGSIIGYLAQHDLLSQIPSLRADISIPDYCYTDPPAPAPGTPLALKGLQPKLDEPLLNVWIGPAGTVSPLHTDPYHNLLCQVVGKKYVRLYNPYETDKLYPKGTERGGIDMSNTSEVDVEADNRDRDQKYPLFRNADYVETIISEGECLYIPVGWWHYVRSLTVSISVSFWWN